MKAGPCPGPRRRLLHIMGVTMAMVYVSGQFFPVSNPLLAVRIGFDRRARLSNRTTRAAPQPFVRSKPLLLAAGSRAHAGGVQLVLAPRSTARRPRSGFSTVLISDLEIFFFS